MNDDDETKLRQENLILRKKLERGQRKMRVLESLQDQNAAVMHALMRDLEAERAESERLLLNILPEPIARRLKAEDGVIAEEFESASVLFADIVGFAELSKSLSPQEMVGWLNEVYSAFDGFVRDLGLEKIRTIGDNYMVAGGVPFAREDHAIAITRLAVKIRDHVARRPRVRGRRMEFRIGINSGPLVGGVIGTHKFQYDIWGDTVNTASRMESHGIPGRIHVSEHTHALIRDAFECEKRGLIAVKGLGEIETFFVVEPK